MELKELGEICKDFDAQIVDLQEHLTKDIQKLELNKRVQGQITEMLVDEDGNPVNLLEEVIGVQD